MREQEKVVAGTPHTFFRCVQFPIPGFPPLSPRGDKTRHKRQVETSHHITKPAAKVQRALGVFSATTHTPARPLLFFFRLSCRPSLRPFAPSPTCLSRLLFDPTLFYLFSFSHVAGLNFCRLYLLCYSLIFPHHLFASSLSCSFLRWSLEGGFASFHLAYLRAGLRSVALHPSTLHLASSGLAPIPGSILLNLDPSGPRFHLRACYIRPQVQQSLFAGAVTHVHCDAAAASLSSQTATNRRQSLPLGSGSHTNAPTLASKSGQLVHQEAD